MVANCHLNTSEPHKLKPLGCLSVVAKRNSLTYMQEHACTHACTNTVGQGKNGSRVWIFMGTVKGGKA